MRIAIVTNTSWNIYNFRLGLARELEKHGHEVLAIAPPDEFSAKIQNHLPFYPVAMCGKGINPFQDILLVYRLYKLYRELQPDCILHYTIKPNIYGNLAAKLAGCKSINTVSGLGTVFLHTGLVSKIAIALYKWAFSYSSKVVFQNNEDCQLFIQKRIVEAKQTALVPGSGVDLEKYSWKTKPPQTPFRFLMLARLLYDKGLVEFIDAIKILKE